MLLLWTLIATRVIILATSATSNNTYPISEQVIALAAAIAVALALVPATLPVIIIATALGSALYDTRLL